MLPISSRVLDRLRNRSAAIALACLLAGCRASAPRPLPIEVAEIREAVDGQPVRGWVARVDLRDPRVDIRVTGPVERRPDDPSRLEARAQTTPDWLLREGLVLAVNTHFFARLDDGQGPVQPGAPLDLIGPCVSEGRIVSPAQDDGPSPVLALTPTRRACIEMRATSGLAGTDDVVCGIGRSGKMPGGLLVEHGANRGASALPRPQERHPRTAAGLTADGRTLLLVVIDGRQPEWSVGMTLPELSDLMIRLGADAAVNLDGGGSSSFVFAPPAGPRIENRPSDGHWRPVGASLGVRIRP